MWTTSFTQAIALLNLVFGIIDIGDATTTFRNERRSRSAHRRDGSVASGHPIANDLLTSAHLAEFTQQQIGRLINHYKATHERVGVPASSPYPPAMCDTYISDLRGRGR